MKAIHILNTVLLLVILAILIFEDIEQAPPRPVELRTVGRPDNRNFFNDLYATEIKLRGPTGTHDVILDWQGLRCYDYSKAAPVIKSQISHDGVTSCE